MCDGDAHQAISTIHDFEESFYTERYSVLGRKLESKVQNVFETFKINQQSSKILPFVYKRLCSATLGFKAYLENRTLESQ